MLLDRDLRGPKPDRHGRVRSVTSFLIRSWPGLLFGNRIGPAGS